MNEMFNKAGELLIRFGWKVLDAEAKKAMLKELTPKKSRVKKEKHIYEEANERSS